MGSSISPDSVKVKTSKIIGAGRGVFANRDFEKDELVCLYGGISISHDDFELLLQKDLDANVYALSDVSGQIIIGDRNPTSPIEVAQLINDGASLYLEKSDTNKIVKKKILSYLKKSSKMENVGSDIDDPRSFYATRDIAMGEELYFTYSSMYWISLEIIRSPDEDTEWFEKLKEFQSLAVKIEDKFFKND